MRYINENNNNPIDFFLRDPHNKIKVVDLKLDMKVQMEYFAFLSAAAREYGSGESSMEALMERAFDAGAPPDERKRILAWLSCSEEVEALRALEQYEKSCPEEMKGFVAICVYQCRTGIESMLLDERHAVVVSGMGGKDDKIRYFAALMTLSGQPWTTTEQHLLREELVLTSKEHDAVVEVLEFSGKYAKMLFLIPITLPPITVVRSAKNASNELGVFISPQEVITNVSRLSDEELDKIFSGEEWQPPLPFLDFDSAPD
ncbi:MAG: hypothetical protein LBT94_09355 [Prevotellaceae bacterium]|jgi:hypothetical protein|nr:hypothetical protein [Prevotellaceae bacterium]